MQLAKSGDTDAFSQLYEMYFTPVYRYVYLRIRNRGDTEDIAQVVFLKLTSQLKILKRKIKICFLNCAVTGNFE